MKEMFKENSLRTRRLNYGQYDKYAQFEQHDTQEQQDV